MSLISGIENFYASEGYVMIFYRKIFVHSAEIFCRAVLCFRKFLVPNKFMDKKGEYRDFLSKKFCLTVPRNFVAQVFRVSLLPGIAKFYA